MSFSFACQKSDSNIAIIEDRPINAEVPLTRNVFLFLGDSLTAGQGVSQQEAYPALLAKRWASEQIYFKPRNAGVSGSTSQGVLDNLDWHFSKDIHTVFLAIGANDGLRGQNISHIKSTISQIIAAAQKKGIRVILAGIQIPTNYGQKYTNQFKTIYLELAAKYKIKLMPFLLKGVALDPELNVEDGIHPNAQGHEILAENVHQFLIKENLLK